MGTDVPENMEAMMTAAGLTVTRPRTMLRRSFLGGLVALTTPAIIRSPGLLMPIAPVREATDRAAFLPPPPAPRFIVEGGFLWHWDDGQWVGVPNFGAPLV
jgi:hypothetical protein